MSTATNNQLTKGPFKFNLLPPKSEQEVVLELERDDSLLYSMVLVFVAGLTFFGLTMVNLVLINPRVNQFEQAIASRDSQISTFASVRSRNGELYVKTRTLEPVLERRINTTEIFRVADAIAASSAGVAIEAYGRERSGEFIFDISTASFAEMSSLVDSIKSISGVSQVFVRTTTSTLEGRYLSSVSLFIDGA